MLVDDLRPNTTYTYRTGRAGPITVIWSSWRTGALYIQTNKKGKVGIVCAEGGAEHGPESYEGNGMFLSEDYYLQIKELM